ncbi:hypothetical protein BDZ85DRAFT_301458 [Elsinoe ampelina]|uniref:Uncharacterized protein n=1 Tax=Elsinoe ampelina TaxID=302913 RepID=A0A6A6G6U2_9PEZI|nr:hypothetical protein BDZ85DRAFT_301458 [Elsinoe ampelina]
MTDRAPQNRPFVNLVEIVKSPCGQMELQYYDDALAPDELTAMEFIVFGAGLSSVPGTQGWALAVCSPETDGNGCGLKEIVRSTPVAQLRERLWRLDEFHGDREAQDMYCAELRMLQTRGIVRTGFEPGVARYGLTLQRRQNAQYWRKYAKDPRWDVPDARPLAIAQGPAADEEKRRRRFQHAMTGLREELLQATRQGDVLAEIAASRQMRREQLDWGFDLGGNRLDQATRNALTRSLGLSG